LYLIILLYVLSLPDDGRNM